MKLKLRVVIIVLLAFASTLMLMTWLNTAEESLTPEAPGPHQAHLQVLRKDLDMSNYTSEHIQNNLLAEDEALEFLRQKILQNPSFRKKEYLERLLRTAYEMNQTNTSGTKQKITREFLPEDLNENLKGETEDSQQELHRHSNNRQEPHSNNRQEPHTVELSSVEVQSLTQLRGRRRFTSRTKPRPIGLYGNVSDRNLTSSQLFHKHINQFDLYQSQDRVVDILVKDLTSQPIVDCIMKGGGTQLKLTFYFQDGSRAMFKPMRFTRDQETLPDHFYFTDYERHNAEIAAFHLDRLLEFHRVPPTAGRLVNVTQDIKRFAQPELLKTFFVSPAGNICFHGQCDYYCDTSHAVCGRPDTMEGCFMAYLPSSREIKRKTWRHPWRRSYHKRKKAEWETDNSYCIKVRSEPPYNSGRRLLDLIDMAVFDFLMGNLDRHHYETLQDFGNFTFPLHLDNGRAFGKPRYDDLSILAPIYQCCLFRYTTLQKLLRFNAGPLTLGDAMRASLAKDSISPILVESHFTALNRRVKILLKTVYKCIQKNGGSSRVVIDDGF